MATTMHKWQRKRPGAGRRDAVAEVVHARLLAINMAPFALAAKAGVRVASIYNWLNGTQEMRSGSLCKVLAALDLVVCVDGEKVPRKAAAS